MRKGSLAVVIKAIIFYFLAAISAEFSVRADDEQPASDSPGLSPVGARHAGDIIYSPAWRALTGDPGVPGFAEVLEPRQFSFPADHGPHPRFRHEWWYLTGNLDSSGGERFGYELTFFRFALAPESTVHGVPGEVRSDWRTNQVYVGHFAITDVESEEFHVVERFARGALGLAGATSEPFRVWVEDWWLKGYPEANGSTAPWLLHAGNDSIVLTLTLVPLKPPVLNGIDGLSQKSAEAGSASYYYSIPRMQTDGTLKIADDVYDVSGLSWLDREWGSSALSKEQQGWDWFALQLSDGSDFMFYRLRQVDGTTSPFSAGTFIPAEGDSVHLARDDVDIEVRDHWDSPEGGRYPMAWTIVVPKLALELQVDPVLDAQELDTFVRYWEGAVDVTGERLDEDIEGRGYVELTGYAEEQ